MINKLKALLRRRIRLRRKKSKVKMIVAQQKFLSEIFAEHPKL
jgi:hypothetical protein